MDVDSYIWDTQALYDVADEGSKFPVVSILIPAGLHQALKPWRWLSVRSGEALKPSVKGPDKYQSRLSWNNSSNTPCPSVCYYTAGMSFFSWD